MREFSRASLVYTGSSILVCIYYIFLPIRRQEEEERLRQQKLREMEEKERALKEQEERWRRERQEEDERFGCDNTYFTAQLKIREMRVAYFSVKEHNIILK